MPATMIAGGDRQPLGQHLLGRGLLTAEQLDRALQEQHRCNHQKLLGEILVELRLCTEEQVTESLADAYGVPYVRVSPKVADPKVIGLLPRAFLEKHLVLPLFLVDGTLTVAVPEPANVFLIEEMEQICGHPVQVVAATSRDIKSTLQIYLPEQNVFVSDDLLEEVAPEEFAVAEHAGAMRSAAAPVAPASADPPPAIAADGAGSGPVLKLIQHLLYSAIKESASDIHIESGDGVLRVRYRIDGQLHEKLRPPLQMLRPLIAAIKNMAALNVAQSVLPQEGCIRLTVNKRPVELRVSTMPLGGAEKIVIRILDHDRNLPNLERLGFTYDALKQWRKLLSMSNGLLLVSGPGGGGKSTTLHASVREWRADRANVCTIVERVRHALPGVNQFTLNEAAGFDDAAALRALLGQEPDAIMLERIGDRETAQLASQAAMNRQLVLAAINAPDAGGAVARLFNLGVEPYVLGASVAAVLCQRLVRKLCPICREPYTPTINERRQMEKILGRAETLYRPKGCAQCHNGGFAGRVGIFELLAVDREMSDRLSAAASLKDIRDALRAANIKTLRHDGMEKAKAGVTTLDEIFRVTNQ